jgi:hypothetical protein
MMDYQWFITEQNNSVNKSFEIPALPKLLRTTDKSVLLYSRTGLLNDKLKLDLI